MTQTPEARDALAILRCFEEGPAELQSGEIARRAQVAERAVEAAPATLCAEEFLDLGADGTYRLGKVLAILGRRMEEATGLDRAQALLEEMTGRTGESASLSVRSGAQAIVLLLAPSPQRLRVEHGVGSRLPLHASAMGKALLAFSDQAPDAAVRELGALEQFTAHTVTTPSELVAELRVTLDRGWAVNREERYDGVVGVAAPVIVPGRGVVAAVGVQGPAVRVRTPDDPALTRLVERTAQRIAKCLAAGSPLPCPDATTRFSS